MPYCYHFEYNFVEMGSLNFVLLINSQKSLSTSHPFHSKWIIITVNFILPLH